MDRPTTDVTIVDGPIAAAPIARWPGAGAIVVFEGLVRGSEAGREIDALTYESYDPMAENMLRRIGDEVIAKHALTGLIVVHSRGRVRVGECSLRVTAGAPHRREALDATAEFIDRLKKDVPIWKSVV